jgi:protein MpaA
VDLNRNFASRNWRAEHAPGYFPGPAPLSEPETRLLVGLVDAHAPRGVVAVHAPFACVNYDGPPSAAAWAREVAAACGWPARGDIGYPTPGSLGSWLGVDRGLPVLTLELPPGPHAAFGSEAAAALDAAVRPRTAL